MEKARVIVTDIQLGRYEQKIEADDKESLVQKIDQIAQVCRTYGFFDDTNEYSWVFIPSSAILKVEFVIKEMPF